MVVQLDKRRARNPEDKQVRREAIVAAARNMLAQASYAEVTMAEVAAAAGVAKGTVYLYYRTKEQLMLAVYQQELSEWLGELGAELIRANCRTPEQFGEMVGAVLARRPVFAALTALLHTLLEHNIDLETAVAFKRRLREQAAHAGAVVESCLSFLRPGDGALVLRRCHALLVGVHSVAVPSPIVAEALREPDLELFKVDFATEFVEILVALLRGMEVSCERSS